MHFSETYILIARSPAGHYGSNRLLNNVFTFLFSDLDHLTFNTSSQRSTSVLESSYFIVLCNATSNPTPSYSWTSSSGQLLSSTGALVFQNVQRSDAKTYTCMANNSVGLQKTSYLTVDVQCEFELNSVLLKHLSYIIKLEHRDLTFSYRIHSYLTRMSVTSGIAYKCMFILVVEHVRIRIVANFADS